MRVRRCAVLMIEPRERLEFDLALVNQGGDGLRPVIECIAHAPHLLGEVPLSEAEAAVLSRISPTVWTSVESFDGEQRSVAEALLAKHLLVGDTGTAADADRAIRDTCWRTTSAVLHFSSRWNGVDTRAPGNPFADSDEQNMLDRLGAAPPAVHEHVAADARIALPTATPTDLDRLLGRRVTCRNYDRRPLPLDSFSAVLYRAFGARAVDDYAPGLQVLKKSAPSAGGLHPTEAYLLVQNVDGVECGLYHYHPVAHALEPLRVLDRTAAAALLQRFVASQEHFLGAHAVVIPAARFRRQSWKYRNHAKAYRALVLDVGHLSQTLYLAATELGLGAFITAAINEVDIEAAFGLDPLEEGPLAVCGFGIRAAERAEVEFDPLNAVWPKDG
jgi:putative peptide maturation dehydrogenase